MVNRKGRTAGLPEQVFKPFREIWDLPSGWKDAFRHEIDGVLYTHGTGMSGPVHVKCAVQNRQSSVVGHIHHTGAVEYLVSERDRIFGINVGCGIDRKAYAFEYGRDFTRKPFLGCGVVTDEGKYAQVFPMEL